MKKLVIGLLVALAVTVGIAPQTAQAAAADEVKISGVVSDQGVPLPGVTVQVECWQTGFIDHPVTDADGRYTVITDTLRCPLGTTLKVRAGINNSTKEGFKFGTVQLVNELDLPLLPVPAVPEYGWLSGTVAVGAGVGAIVFLRRRLAQQEG